MTVEGFTKEDGLCENMNSQDAVRQEVVDIIFSKSNLSIGRS